LRQLVRSTKCRAYSASYTNHEKFFDFSDPSVGSVAAATDRTHLPERQRPGRRGDRADQPGFRHFHVRPQVEGPLPHVTVTFRSVRGWIRSAWRKENGRLEMRVEVPADSTATIRVPGSGVAAEPGADAVRTGPRATHFHAGPGVHTFTAELA